jgi:shikimate dehydrogenase
MTPFIQWAKNQGAVLYSDGLGMLIEQAAESFYIWRSIRPQVQLVWACLSRSS